METPEWLKKTTPLSACSCCKVSFKKRRNFVSKTLIEIASLIERSIFSEKLAKENGLLQKINPKVKLIIFLSFIILTSLVKNIEILIIIYMITLFAAIISKIPIKEFLIRVWLFIPLFSGIIALPVLLNIMTPGNPIITLINLHTPINILGLKFSSLTITTQGIIAFSFFVLRIGTIVSITTLLTLTTRWVDILKSLRILGLPQIFVLVLSLTYQFIFILLRIIQDMHLAKKSRTINKQKRANKDEQKWVASRIGTILIKSRMMSEETYLAMISRGFNGEIKNDSHYLIKSRDYIFGSISLSVLLIIILIMW